MSWKVIRVTVPIGVGAVALAWAAVATRAPEPPPAKPARAAAKPAPRPAAGVPAPLPAPPVSREPDLPPLVETGGEYAVIEGRVRAMEERARELEARRTQLTASNQDLEKQVNEKVMSASWRAMAEMRIKPWEALLGLTESQKQSLLDLATQWQREDGGKLRDKDTWLSREADVRSRLSVEQAGKLHDSVTAQSQKQWAHMGQTLGMIVGASKEDQTRFQQSLGEFPAPNLMLLPEAYGADWYGQLREVTSQLKPMLSSDQLTRLVPYLQH